MAIEIERKFLVRNDGWKRDADSGTLYIQGYLCSEKNRAIRIRTAGRQAFISLKLATSARVRKEYEYEIPFGDAEEIMKIFSNRPPVEKTRYKLRYRDHLWEIDVFCGENEGLTLAEIELTDEHEKFECPDWLGAEVTDDGRYVNAALYLRPFKSWNLEVS